MYITQYFGIFSPELTPSIICTTFLNRNKEKISSPFLSKNHRCSSKMTTKLVKNQEIKFSIRSLRALLGNVLHIASLPD